MSSSWTGSNGVVAVAWLCLVGALHADDPVASAPFTDRVVVQQAGRTSRMTVTGTIEDYTGRALILQTRRAAGTMRYSRSEVVEVTTTYSAPHVAGRKLFAEARIAEADEAFEQALDEEERTWVRRDILASQVKCALWRGDYKRAAQRFLAIVESDSDTLYFGLMPLVWQEQPPTSVIGGTGDARRWLQSESAAARLIGASWLYHGSDQAAATRVLKELASAPQPMIQRFAQMQLWRVRLDGRDLSLADVRRWVTLTDELSANLRAGPYFLIGRAYEQQHDDLNAAAAWLWLPFEHPELRHLAAEAQVRAAEALFRAGDIAAARQQAREVSLRFENTLAATRALQLEQRITAAERTD